MPCVKGFLGLQRGSDMRGVLAYDADWTYVHELYPNRHSTHILNSAASFLVAECD